MAKLTDLFVNIGARTNDLDKGLNSAKSKLSNFGNFVSKIGGLVAGAFAVSRIIGFTKEIIKLSGETQGVKYAFDALNKPGLLEDLRKATRGTVSDLELMKSAVQANNFKIPLEQLGSLLKFAHLRAQQTGQSVDYLVQSIVLGIGRKSPLILDNLGISAIELREKFKGVGVETASVGDIAKAVGEIAESAMKKSGEAIETSASAIDRMNASWQNTKVVIGDILIPTVAKLAGLLERAASGWKNILNPGAVSQDLASSDISRITKELGGLSKENALKKIQDETSRIRAITSNLSQEKQTKETKQLIQSYAIVDNWLRKLWTDYNALNSVIAPPKEEVKEAVRSAEEIKKAYEEYLKIASEFTRAGSPGMGGTDIAYKGGRWRPKDPKLKLNEVKPFEGSNRFTPDTKGMEDVLKKNEEIEESFDRAGKAGEKFASIMSGSFSDVKNIKDFANAVKNAARDVIAAQIAEAVAVNIAKAVGKAKTWWGAILAGAAAGAATSALFNSIPSFAEGGIVKGKQLVIAGDNPSGVEAMIPKEDWGKFGATKLSGEVVLRGRDAYILLKNYESFRNKII